MKRLFLPMALLWGLYVGTASFAQESGAMVIVCDDPNQTAELLYSFGAKIGTVPERLAESCGELPSTLLLQGTTIATVGTPHATANIVAYLIPMLFPGETEYRLSFGFTNFTPRIDISKRVEVQNL